jgi:hypothetical protein
MFETGEQYFAFRCDGFKSALQAFRQSKEMWNWWKMQYMMIDQELLVAADQQPDIPMTDTINLDIYQAIHLGLEYYPHKTLVKKVLVDYEVAVKNVIEKQSI